MVPEDVGGLLIIECVRLENIHAGAHQVQLEAQQLPRVVEVISDLHVRQVGQLIGGLQEGAQHS